MQLGGEAAALLNAVFWAATGVTAKALGRAVRPYHIITAHTLIASAGFIVILYATGNIDRVASTPATSLALFSAAALLNTVGGFIFFTAVSSGSVGGTYTTTTGLYVLLSLVAGAVFFDERIAPLAVAGAGAIVGGIYVLNGPGRITSSKVKESPAPAPGRPQPAGAPARQAARLFNMQRMFTGMGLGITTAVLWTMGLLVLKWGLEGSDELTAGFMRNAVAALVYAGAGYFMGRKAFPQGAMRRDWLWLVLGGCFFTSSTFLWNYAIAHIEAGKTAVLASTAPVFAVAMAVILLRERMSWMAVAGSGTAVGGTLMVVLAK